MLMKKWSEMTQDEKLEFLLEWADKTHKKLEETIYVINEIIDHLENPYFKDTPDRIVN